jgi:phytoene dehydrogenase-like protein
VPLVTCGATKACQQSCKRLRLTRTCHLSAVLFRGLKKHGGQLYLNSHVESITLDSSGKATGVQLRGGGTIKARKAVVSNASVWDTVKLLPADHPAAQSAVLKFDREAQDTPECNSFMHLHVGFDKTGMCCGCLVVSQGSPAALYLHGGCGVES